MQFSVPGVPGDLGVHGVHGVSFGRKIDDRRDPGADEHHQHLIPIKERYSSPGRLNRVIEWYPQGPYEWHQEEQIPPIAAGLRLLVVHGRRKVRPKQTVSCTRIM